jgi:hypothetical protein
MVKEATKLDKWHGGGPGNWIGGERSLAKKDFRQLIRVARFFLVHYTRVGKSIPNDQMAMIYTNWPENIPNGHKIYQHFPFKCPTKYTKFGIFWYENIPSGNPAADPLKSETLIELKLVYV